MMSQRPCDGIFVRDSQRSLSWQECDAWDRTTMLACLSSDPRSLEELSLAWSRYRPDQPLMELGWHEAPAMPEAGQSAAGKWLAIDLSGQRYAWCDSNAIAAEPGCFGPDDVEADGRNSVAWLNVPPWWQQVPAEQWSVAVSQPGANDARQRFHGCRVQGPPFNFRSTLYGQPVIKYIAEQALACKPKPRASRVARSDTRDAASMDTGSVADELAQSRDGFTAQERAQAERWEKATKRIHGRWLMTPRAELGDQPPRHFLHIHRAWKDRELEHRRSQWSRERRPPPPVPRTADLFRYGPMGTEEVMCYFDLCRLLIGAALQWVDDEPGVSVAELLERLERLRDGWLTSEAIEGDGMTVQEVIDGERQLMPRVASSDPIDCDCPLCRIHELEPEMFGPAFSMCDTYREEMEEDFVFSLHAQKEDWEEAREEWLSWSDSMRDPSGSSEDADASETSGDQSSSLEAAESDWPKVWQASFSDTSQANPQLSLLGIGAHLGEIIMDLKRINAAREEIDQLNRAFDQLGRSIRDWLTREVTSDHLGDSACGEPAAGEMVRLLEAMAVKRPELTAKSADLQSQIHKWQRQLSPSRGG